MYIQAAALESAEAELKRRHRSGSNEDNTNKGSAIENEQRVRETPIPLIRIIVMLMAVSGLAYGLNTVWEKNLQNGHQVSDKVDVSSLAPFPPISEKKQTTKSHTSSLMMTH